MKDKDDSDVSFYAAEALANIGKSAVDPLVTALKDESPQVRFYAARALGEIKDLRAVEPLIGTLKDDNSGVRENAAEALMAISKEDFGEDYDKWKSWWERREKE